jgi:hypothetical protein
VPSTAAAQRKSFDGRPTYGVTGGLAGLPRSLSLARGGGGGGGNDVYMVTQVRKRCDHYIRDVDGYISTTAPWDSLKAGAPSILLVYRAEGQLLIQMLVC